jgi:epoxyqueuosine reductase
LLELFDLEDAAFKQRFRETPLWRPKRRGILRNAAIVLGNQRAAEAIPALMRGLDDPEPLVRGACAWALGRFTSEAARRELRLHLSQESDEIVRQEIEHALTEAKVDAPPRMPPG